MNTALSTALAVLGVVAAIWAAFVAAKSNARETRRARNEEIVNAVRMALDPKEAELARKEIVITDLRQTIRDRDRRIEQLEDDLRGGRG
jgi:TolA-binding protein